MSAQTVAYIHHKTCKTAKLEAGMTKGLKKAVKGKDEKIRYRFTKDKVEFKGRKEVIDRNKIGRTQKNTEHKIIVVATTAEKNRSNVYALKFADDTNFNDFYEKLSNKPSSDSAVINENKPAPPVSNSPPVQAQRPRSEGPTLNDEPPISNRRESPEPNPSRPISQHRSLRGNSIQPSAQTSPIQMAPPRQFDSPQDLTAIYFENLSPSIHEQPKPTQIKQSSRVSSSYISTDVLKAPKRARSPKKRNKKLSSNDVYPMRGKHRSGTNLNYYDYIPGKGLVKSSDGNIYFCASRVRSGSLPSSASNMSDSSTSDSTSTHDIFYDNTFFRLVPLDGPNAVSPINRSVSPMRQGSVTSTSSSSSRASSTTSSFMRDQQPTNINVWKYKESNSTSPPSSSSTTSVVPVEKLRSKSSRSRSRNTGEVVICPTCHRRSRSRGPVY